MTSPPAELAELPSLPVGVSTLTSEESDRLRRLYPDLAPSPLDHPQTCVTCRGAGTFEWYAYYTDEPDDTVVTYRCPCIDQWLLGRFLLSSNVKPLYQRMSMHDLTDVEPEALGAVLEYQARSDAFVNRGIGMILHGTVGSGKSALAMLVLKRLLADGHDGYFITFSELVSRTMDSWRDVAERDYLIRRVRNAGVLVIDDIGREHHQRQVTSEGGTRSRVTTATSESTLDELIRHRVAMSKPTIVTTNLDLETVDKNYGNHILSLLYEQSLIKHFGGEDFRKVARDRNLQESYRGLTRPVVVS